MIPVLFKWASSASASPGAFRRQGPALSRRTRNDHKQTHHSPFKAKRLYHTLHAIDEPMLFPRDSLATLDLGALGAVEDEEREKGGVHEAGATKKQGSQLGILALSPVGGMKEPDGGIDSNTKTSEIGRVQLESVNNGEVCERSQLTRRSKDLREI